MSYWIEYQSACFVIPDGFRGVKGTRFVIASEGGSSNLTERTGMGRERRVRDWYVSMIGSHEQVLRQAVRIAGDCEGLSLRMNGRDTTPEAYIRRTRRLLANPRTDVDGHITLCATVDTGHVLVARASQFGMPSIPEQQFGRAIVRLYPPGAPNDTDWGSFFRAIEPCLCDGTLAPGRLGDVWGMPRS